MDLTSNEKKDPRKTASHLRNVGSFILFVGWAIGIIFVIGICSSESNSPFTGATNTTYILWLVAAVSSIVTGIAVSAFADAVADNLELTNELNERQKKMDEKKTDEETNKN